MFLSFTLSLGRPGMRNGLNPELSDKTLCATLYKGRQEQEAYQQLYRQTYVFISGGTSPAEMQQQTVWTSKRSLTGSSKEPVKHLLHSITHIPSSPYLPFAQS